MKTEKDVSEQFEEVVEDEESEDKESKDELRIAEENVTQAKQKVDEVKQKVDEAEQNINPWSVQQVATETREVFYNSKTKETLQLNQVLCKILNNLEE